MKIIYPETRQITNQHGKKQQLLVGSQENDVDVEDDNIVFLIFFVVLRSNSFRASKTGEFRYLWYQVPFKNEGSLRPKKYGLQALKIAGRGLGSHGTCSEESPIFSNPQGVEL